MYPEVRVALTKRPALKTIHFDSSNFVHAICLVSFHQINIILQCGIGYAIYSADWLDYNVWGRALTKLKEPFSKRLLRRIRRIKQQLNKLSVFIQFVWTQHSGCHFPGTYKTLSTKNMNSEYAKIRTRDLPTDPNKQTRATADSIM